MIRTLAGGLLIGLVLGTAGQAQDNVLLSFDRDEIRILTAQSVQARDWTQARALAQALLQRDPNDIVALTALAQATFQLGDFTAAREAAARIYRSDAEPQRRYDAARLAALSASNQDRFTLAELWLRRALTVAPTEADAAQTTRDAAGVSRLNPWSTSVSLSFAPSTNVNGGSEDEINVIDGVPVVGLLSASAQALSGLIAQADLSTAYRLRENAQSRTLATARLYGRGVALTDDSLDAIKEEEAETGNRIKVGDFSTARLEFGISHDQVATGGAFGIDVAAGGYWSGAEYDYTYGRVAVDRSVSIGPRDALRGSVFYEQRFDAETNDPEDEVYGVQAQYLTRLGNGADASLSLAWSRRDSPFVNNESETWTLQAGYAPREQIGPARVSGTLGVQLTDFDYYFVGFIDVPGGRSDERLFASVQATFVDYSYAGFSPLVRLNAGRTESNVSRFNLTELSLDIGIRSTF